MKHSESRRMTLRFAKGAADRDAILDLRTRCFPHRGGGREQWERYDALCRHLIVCGAGGRGNESAREGDGGGPIDADRTGEKGSEETEASGGPVLASLRIMVAPMATVAEAGYAARFYDLSPLRAVPGPVVEVGRLCLSPGPQSWEALRLLLAALTRLVDDVRAGLMLGCTSFAGADWRRHRAALAFLAAGHLGPAGLLPRRRTGETVDYPQLANPDESDSRAALSALPPLLRFYLSLGGWVSDHAVVDRDLDTLHVLTCVETGGIPARRAARLRSLAGKMQKGAPGQARP